MERGKQSGVRRGGQARAGMNCLGIVVYGASRRESDSLMATLQQPAFDSDSGSSRPECC